MSNMFLPKTIPTDFTGDFKTPSSTGEGDEGLVQCCQYPSRRDRNKDNSTIIEFEYIPVEKKEHFLGNSDRIPGSEGRKRSGRNCNYYDQMTMTESRQHPTVVYHHQLGAQYVGIHQPPNVVTTQNALLAVKRKDSAMSTGSDYPAEYSSSSMSSTASIPSVSTSTLSLGFKYKTHLLSRYSSELEEENRLLKQIIRKP